MPWISRLLFFCNSSNCFVDQCGSVFEALHRLRNVGNYGKEVPVTVWVAAPWLGFTRYVPNGMALVSTNTRNCSFFSVHI